jgi:carbamoyl-phosphate synthase small subunit
MNAPVAMKLLLEDGTEMSGRAFGAAGSVGGEVVFNTAMAGYVEALTDPSYRGQILVLTYPLVGSYGVPAPRALGSLDGPYESSRIQVQGLVVQAYVDRYSHHAATRSLGAWLEAEGVPGISGIDTRTLTRRLREHGTMKGWLVPAKDTTRGRNAAETVDMKEVFRLVAPDNVIRYEGDRLVRPRCLGNKMQQLLMLHRSLVRRRYRCDRLHAPAAFCDQETGAVIIHRPRPVGVADHAC